MKKCSIRRLALFAALGLLLSNQGALRGQEITPVVYNFGKADYGFDAQNWAVGCFTDGTMCFGNGNGLLCYDGTRWELFPLPGGKTLRSLLCYGDRIYAGTYEEFGYFERSASGLMQYTSLSDLLEDYDFHNDEIWTILNCGDELVFHSFSTIFRYRPSDGSLRSVPLSGFTESIALAPDGSLLSSFGGVSLIDTESGELQPFDNLPFDGRMVAMLPFSEGKGLLITVSDGLFIYSDGILSPFHTQADALLRSCVLNRAFLTREGNFVLGSTQDGIFCISPKGRLLWHLNTSNVLSDNTILGLGADPEGNVWAAMDSGIAMIHSSDYPRSLAAFSPSLGAVYSVLYREPYLYIGSNQGLYRCTFDARSLTLGRPARFPQVKGNVWYIDSFDDQILCGTNGATWEIDGARARAVPSDNVGGTCMAQGLIDGRRVLVQGTYTELCIYLRDSFKWAFSHRIEGFIQPIGSIAVDNLGNIWAAHSEGGLYRIRLDSSLRSIASMEYFASLSGEGQCRVSVFNLFGRIVFADGDSFYTYDDLSSALVPYHALNAALGRFSSARTVSDAADGHSAWFIKGDEAALFSFDADGTARLCSVLPYALFRGMTVDRKAEIKALSDSLFVATLYNSLAFITPSSSVSVSEENLPGLYLSRVQLSDATREEPFLAPTQEGGYDFPFKYRLIRLSLSCPRYSLPSQVRFRWMLRGRDMVWNDSSGEIELSFLPEGKYTLSVQALNCDGKLIDSLEVPFRVRPPWYRSLPALSFYCIAALFFLTLLLSVPIRRTREQRREVEKQRLENEVEAKSRELALSAMNLSRKNELLRQLKAELEEQKKALGDAWPNRYYRQVISSIDKFTTADDDWEMFEKNFDLIHGDFFKKLRSRYPSLTASDLRFCAYLCMNLSSKEIASMMNISLKGVEAARWRIRRKLDLPSKQNLSEFLMGI